MSDLLESKSRNQFNYVLLALVLIHLMAGAYYGHDIYSGVPRWDSWDAMIGFIIEYKNHDLSYWFSQHFEHRIIISRLLFWLNYVLFNGDILFLVILNYVFTALSCLLFFFIIREVFANEELVDVKNARVRNFAKNYIISIAIIFSFSQLQDENLNWDFQSQFFLAYLFPLICLYFLGKSSADSKNSSNLFIASCIFGILSAGTMVNGVFTLPAAMVLAIALKLGRNKVLILLGLSITVLLLYLYGYEKPEKHTSIEVIFVYPFEIFIYLITYCGSVFGFIFGYSYHRVMGLIFLTLVAVNVWRLLSGKEQNWINSVLIIFMSYVALSGMITAIGRIAGSQIPLQEVMLDKFPSSPDSDRYKTPILMGWLSIIIIYSNLVTKFLEKLKANKYIALILPFLFVMHQLSLLDKNIINRVVFEKRSSVLALELGARDEEQISDRGWSSIHGDISFMDIAQKASKANISIFNDKLFRDVGQKIGKKIHYGENAPRKDCTKDLTSSIKIKKIIGERKFKRISGPLEENTIDELVNSFYVVNNRDIITGYVIVHKSKRGFKGYILSESSGENLYLHNPTVGCIKIQ